MADENTTENMDTGAQPPITEVPRQPDVGNVQVDTNRGEVQEDGSTVFAKIGDKTFATQEELSKWWDEEGSPEAQARRAQEGGQDSQTATTKEDDAPRSDEEIIASLKEAGGIYADERYQPFALEFEKTGGLSEDSVKKAAEAFSIPEDFVKQFVEGQKAMRASAGQPTAEQIALAGKLTEVVSDQGEYAKVLEWGRENIPQSLQEAYNAALDRNDAATAQALLKGFYADYKAAGEGKGPRDVTEEGGLDGAHSEEPGYASQEEMLADMRKPEYETDAAFRAKVERRVAKSKGWG